MGFNPRFTAKEINRDLQNYFDHIHHGIVSIMERVGEEFARDAKDGVNISGAFPKGDYTDQTANLRSSIGYAIVYDGAIIATSLPVLDTDTGKIVNEVLTNSVPMKWVLVGFAAMEYASYLESKGYNVITSQSTVAMVDLESRVRKFAKGKDFGASFKLGGVTNAL
jgi:hypothetical protein